MKAKSKKEKIKKKFLKDDINKDKKLLKTIENKKIKKC